LDLVRRFSLAIIVAAAVSALMSCDVEVEIDDVVPRVTWFSAEPVADGVIEMTVWVYDLERKPVDLTVNWSLDDVSQGAIVLAPGGHGLLGLTTDGTPLTQGRPSVDGQAHLLRWALDSSVPSDAAITLAFTPDDRVAGPGATVNTPTFTPASGVATVTAL